MPALHTLTLRLTARQRAKVRQLAERAGVDEQEAILRAVEQAAEEDVLPSAFDLAGDLVGSFSGSPDLATNKAYLAGFGEPAPAPRREP